MQPTIQPLFKTRQFQESLLRWSGNPQTYEMYFRQFWSAKAGQGDAFNKVLQDGIIEPVAAPTGTAVFNAGPVGTSTNAIGSAKKGGNLELVLYQNVALGDGRQANNPWLLELPDPVSRACWDNYVMVSPVVAKKLFNIDLKDRRQSDEYEVHPEKPLVSLKVGNKEMKLPALIIPGMNNDTIAVALGYGRKSDSGKDDDTAKNIGAAVVGVGQNVYPLAFFNGVTTEFYAPDVSLSDTGDVYKVAQVQTHNSYEGREEVIKELTLAEYQKNPNIVMEEREKELAPWGGLKSFDKEGTLYPYYEKPGIKWGMSIDLNTCFGCSACVVACIAENNIPVVGKAEVARFHDMHWLRIDRYFSGNPDDPESIQTIFQPMLCQHCDNAPCENVCPVAATNHNSEGINQMIYNRCIGTRYCANNCPYKVRRFNWADYMGADSFPDNQRGIISDATTMMNDDLSRMVLNPDVTVRSRGVIEKCSFCVQRLQYGKLAAKKENRVLTDNDAKTACQQACPANAIVFGNVNYNQSNISKERSLNKSRLYYSLEPLHTLPNVNYLARVRNTEMIAAHEPTDELKSMKPDRA